MEKANFIMQKVFDDLWLEILIDLLSVWLLLTFVLPRATLAETILSAAMWIIVAALAARLVYVAIAAKRAGRDGEKKPAPVRKRTARRESVMSIVWLAAYLLILYLAGGPLKPYALWLLSAWIVIAAVLLALSLASRKKNKLRDAAATR